MQEIREKKSVLKMCFQTFKESNAYRSVISVVVFIMSLECIVQCSGKSEDATTQSNVLQPKGFKSIPHSDCVGGPYCAPKCCGMNELLSVTVDQGHTCNKSSHNITFNPIFYSVLSGDPKSNEESVKFVNKSRLLDHCNGKLYMYENFCFHIQEDGYLRYRDHAFNWVQISPEHYCVDAVESQQRPPSIGFLDDGANYGFLTCPLYEYTYLGGFISTMFGTGFIVGSVFLLMAFLVYAVLWKEQKIQGWITMSHCVAMLFWYFFLGLSILLDPEVPNRNRRSTVCTVFGIVQHFFSLSNFCWLTVNSFNLFWTFRVINIPNPHSQNIGQYVAYAAFGWGVPLVFVIVSVILDQKYSYDPCNTVIVPEYGFEICFISPSSMGPYLYYPLIVVMSINFAFFSITAYKLCGYKRRPSLVRENMTAKNELFQLIGKLFFLTGFTWILDLVTWLYSRYASGSSSIPWYSGIVNFISVFQVIPIFVIYISKPSVLESLKTKYPQLRPILGVPETCCGCFWLDSGSPKPSSTGVISTTKDEGQANAELRGFIAKSEG